ncbi:MAG: hypothetical protein WBF90_17105 [Rivularia sp. (in: cyanobacteria)]
MSFIQISELRPVGSELFQDSESYLQELSSQEIGTIEGGHNGLVLTSVIESPLINSLFTISQGISVNSVSAISNFA